MKCMYQKWLINKIVAYIEHMSEGGVEQTMVPLKMKSLYIFLKDIKHMEC